MISSYMCSKAAGRIWGVPEEVQRLSLKLSGASSQRATAHHPAPGLQVFTVLVTTGIRVLRFFWG